MSPEQCRAARAMLNLEQSEVAGAAGIARATLIDFEKGTRVPRKKTIEAIQGALEDKGIVFTDGGVSLGERRPLPIEAIERARSVMDEINAEADQGNGLIDERDERIQKRNFALFLWRMELKVVSENGRERLALLPSQ